MLKSITTTAAAIAALTVISLTPVTAAPKAAQTNTETSVLAPSEGTTVVEHGYGYGYRSTYVSYAPQYRSCYWGWRYHKKVWICY